MKEEILHFSKEEKDNKPFHLQMTGISYCDGTYKIKRKNSSTFVFEYVMEGKGYLNINGRKLEPEAGDVYLLPGYTEHEYGSSSDNPWTKIWFNTEGPLVENLIELYSLKNLYLIKNMNIYDIFRDGYDSVLSNPAAAHENASLTVHEIIMRIAGHLKSEEESFRNAEAVKLKNYLDIHSKKNISTLEMAKLINKSVSQVIRIFNSEWGTTPYRYLLNKKINTAKLLLTGTVMTVKEIAFELGFADEYYFSSIFKKKTGKAPVHYRQSKL